MSQSRNIIAGVPTNIITGFLGVGKTSTILQLLNSKPKGERWAVLVNEFGEIGIDGALLEGQYSEQTGVYIREVPGGCMCCTAGLPMRVALAQLLRRAKPDRLLIEPTGLGHPKEVLQTLNDVDFNGVLSVQNILTLVDARHLSNSRYVEHETFQQQIAIADVIVANKQDQYTGEDEKALKAYLQKPPLDQLKLVFTAHGVIDPTLLAGGCDEPGLAANSITSEISAMADLQISASEDQALETSLPECGYIKALNKGEGFVSIGWRFSSRFQFDQTKLFTFLSGLDVERLKATFITLDGFFAYNLTQNALTEKEFEEFSQSRIEIISSEVNDEWERELFSCVATNQELLLPSD